MRIVAVSDTVSYIDLLYPDVLGGGVITKGHYMKVAICRGRKMEKFSSFFFFFFASQPFWKYSLITLLHILPQCLWYFSFKGLSFEDSVWRENWGIVGILDKTETESYITRLCSHCTVKSFIRASADWAIKANKLILFLSHTESHWSDGLYLCSNEWLNTNIDLLHD